MRILLTLLLVMAPSCALMPDGSRAISLEGARAALEDAADAVGEADLNGDGLLQVSSNAGVPLAALQAYLRANSASLLARDANDDGMLDSAELLGAAPMMAARILASAGSMSPQPADGHVGELAMLGLMLADRIAMAMR